MAVSKFKTSNWQLIGSTSGTGVLTYPETASELMIIASNSYSSETDTDVPVYIVVPMLYKTNHEFFGGARFGNVYGVGVNIRVRKNTRSIDCLGMYYNGDLSLNDVTITAYYK